MVNQQIPDRHLEKLQAENDQQPTALRTVLVEALPAASERLQNNTNCNFAEWLTKNGDG